MNNQIKLTVTELFSGIGCQRRGIENPDLFDVNVVATSDIDKDAIVSYASIHHGLTRDIVENYDYPSKEEMIAELTQKRIGYDFVKNTQYDWVKVSKKKDKMKGIEIYWLSQKLSKNLGDISCIDKLPKSDFVIYSSCCQDLSIAGKQAGLMWTCKDCNHQYNPGDYDIQKRYICPHCNSSNIKTTRSGLLFEVERLISKSIECNEQPKYLMLENVQAFVSKKFKPSFDAWLNTLSDLGYNSYYQVLNGSECGIPQSRKRVFVISIRKDIDTGKMDFPIPFDNGLRLKDLLQPANEIDEKYYINTDRARNLIEQLVEKGQLHGNDRQPCDSTIMDPETREISNCITARYDASIQNQKQIGMCVAEPIQNRLGGMFDDETKHQAGSVWDDNGLAPTLDTMAGGLRQPCIITENISKPIGKLEDNSNQRRVVYDSNNNAPTLQAAMGMGGGNTPLIISENKVNKIGNVVGAGKSQGGSVYDKDNISPTLLAGMDHGNVMPYVVDDTNKPISVGNTTPSGKSQCNEVYSTEGVSQTLCAGTHGYATGYISDIADMYRIRKLTPIETGLLMGLNRQDVEKCMENGISNSALYKQHGNGICVPCVGLLAEHLYKAQYDESYVCTDEKIANFINPKVE